MTKAIPSANAGPVVLITGTSRGLGRATARTLSRAGARLIATARSASDLSRAMEDLPGPPPLLLPGDITDPTHRKHLVSETITAFGRLDALINNAGILAPLHRLGDTPEGEWERNIAVNLIAPVLLMQEALPHLRSCQGRIVNISSGAAEKAIQGWAAYCAAKAGLNQANRILALEEPEITAISLRPGVVNTDMQALIREKGDQGMAPDVHARFQDLFHDKKLEPPEKPAGVIAWLALHAPQELSGQFLSYDDPVIAEPAARFISAISE